MANTVKFKTLRALHDDVLVTDMNFDGSVSMGGIILRSDNGKTHGIKPRWGRVYAIGPDQHDVEVGDWILMEHGRWTRAFNVENEDGPFELHKADTNAILLVRKDKPANEMIGDSY